MLHHIPTAAGQNQVLAEVLRVLRPGGTLIGSDSLASTQLHEFHAGDVYNPLEPGSLLTRLQTIGFGAVMISVDRGLTFRARKPAPEPPRWQSPHPGVSRRADFRCTGRYSMPRNVCP